MQVFGLFLNFNVNKKSALKMNYEFNKMQLSGIQ